jgi:Transglycosylase-like domain
MTPQSSQSRSHAPRVRRSAGIAVVAAVLVGLPFVARALEADAEAVASVSAPAPSLREEVASPLTVVADLGVDLAVTVPPTVPLNVPPTVPALPLTVAVEPPTDVVPVPVLAPGPSAQQWAALRECESGGNYSVTNPSGKYRGAYQFDRRTWNSVAERYAPHLVGVDPAAASPADQDAMAYALHSERGARPWPHCGRHLR